MKWWRWWSCMADERKQQLGGFRAPVGRAAQDFDRSIPRESRYTVGVELWDPRQQQFYSLASWTTRSLSKPYFLLESSIRELSLSQLRPTSAIIEQQNSAPLSTLLYQSSAHPSRELVFRETARVLCFLTESSSIQSDRETPGQCLLHSSAFERPSLLSSGWINLLVFNGPADWLSSLSTTRPQASRKSHQSHHLMVSNLHTQYISLFASQLTQFLCINCL